MEFVRWYAGPVTAGFAVSLIVNGFVALLGFLIWLALIFYINRRWSGTAGQ